MAIAAIDGSKFKAVNARDKNFTKAKLRTRIDQVEASIERYMAALETADRQEGELAEAKSARLKDKIAQLREQMASPRALEALVDAAPDQQISLTDPDARSMATSGKGTGVVGYNVQTASIRKHHLIVAHEVTNVGHDRGQLSTMAGEAKAAMGRPISMSFADRGYFEGEEILACEAAGVTPLVPKPLTSGAKAEGRFGKQDFIYDPQDDAYRCPCRARAAAADHHGREGAHAAQLLGPGNAPACALKPNARPPRNGASSAGSTKPSIDAMQERLDRTPEAMRIRGPSSNTPSARSRHGWARPTSRRRPSKKSEPR